MKRWEAVFGTLMLIELVLVGLLIGGEKWAQSKLSSASESDFMRYASIEQIAERFDTETDKRYRPHRYLGYALTPNFAKDKNRHNAHGFRGAEIPVPKPEGEFRIVCVGGSTTYTSDVLDDEYAYPAVLEKVLHNTGKTHVRVINAGCGGWTTWESLVNLELRVCGELEPDLVVIYHAINDAHTRLVWPPEAYRGDNSARREEVTTTHFSPSLWEQSTLLRMAAVDFGWSEPHSYGITERQLMDGHPDTYYGDAFRSQKLAGRYPSGIFERVSAERMFETNRPAFFRRNLRSMVAVARQHGAEAVLATFASSPLFEDKPRVASPEYVAALDEMNDVIRELAAELDAPLFDFAAEFPDDKALYTDGRHMSFKGSVQKGRMFAEFVQSQQLIE